MKEPISYGLLKGVSEAGVMSIQDAVKLVKKRTGSYIDFIPLAILLHAGYVETDTENSVGKEKIKGKFGFDTKSIAEHLALVATPEGEYCELNEMKHHSWSRMEAYVFITAAGALRLEEFYERNRLDRERIAGYRVAILTAVLASIISVALTTWISN